MFSGRAWAEYLHWQGDADRLAKVNKLLEECRRHPFTGTGKPEPLRGTWAGFWSRRISGEHRLVYRITGKSADQQLEVAQCRYHYD